MLAAAAAAAAAAAVTGCDSAASSTAAASAPPGAPALIAARAVRFVKLEELTEWNGREWAAVAEFNLIDATGATVDRKNWSAAADSAGANDGPANAIDGDPATLWHSKWSGEAPRPPHALVINLGAPVRVSGFRYLPRQDKSVNGTIAAYRFYVGDDGENWGAPVAAGDFTQMSAPSLEKTVVFAQQTANHPPVVTPPAAQQTPMGGVVSLPIVANDPDGDPIAYSAAGLPPGLAMGAGGSVTGTPITPGRYTVTVSATDAKSPAVNAQFAWSVLPPVKDAQPAAPGEVRFVRLEEVSEVNGQPWGSMAEFNLVDSKGANLPRDGWRASADSSDASDRPANAIDGSAGSLWHSQWSGSAPPPPHSFIVDLARPTRVYGFRYLPRQDGISNGAIAKYRFYTSTDGVDWGRPVAEGDFRTMGAANAEKTVRLK